MPCVIALEKSRRQPAPVRATARGVHARVDGVLRNVALHAPVVAPVGVAEGAERARKLAHLARSAPRAGHDLADAAHRLRVRGDHRDRAGVVEDVFCRDGLGTDARLGEGDVLGDVFIEVMADHEHLLGIILSGWCGAEAWVLTSRCSSSVLFA